MFHRHTPTRHSRKTFNPPHSCYPRYFFNPRQKFFRPTPPTPKFWPDPRHFLWPKPKSFEPRHSHHPRQSLTHATHKPTHPRYLCHPHYLADSSLSILVENFRKWVMFLGPMQRDYWDEIGGGGRGGMGGCIQTIQKKLFCKKSVPKNFSDLISVKMQFIYGKLYLTYL